MARKRSVAQQRGDSLYAARLARLRAFTSERFPTATRATAYQKSKVRAAFDAIFGRGEKHKPLIGSHSTVVHLVSTKKQEAAARRAADAYNATLPPDATVAHLFQKATPAQIRAMKKGIGQRTPDAVRAIILKQDKVAGEDNVWTTGEIIKLKDRYITVNGDQVLIFRPFNLRAWATDEKAEDARVMAQLRDDVVDIADHFEKKRGFRMGLDTRFSPQVGNHRYIGGEAHEDQIHNLLSFWRSRYGADTSLKFGQAPVSQWLTGLNLTVFLNRDGKQQYDSEWEAQRVRRLKKGQMRRRVERAATARRAQRAPARKKTLPRRKR